MQLYTLQFHPPSSPDKTSGENAPQPHTHAAAMAEVQRDIGRAMRTIERFAKVSSQWIFNHIRFLLLPNTRFSLFLGSCHAYHRAIREGRFNYACRFFQSCLLASPHSLHCCETLSSLSSLFSFVRAARKGRFNHFVFADHPCICYQTLTSLYSYLLVERRCPRLRFCQSLQAFAYTTHSLFLPSSVTSLLASTH
jgi:hypothetical protein